MNMNFGSPHDITFWSRSFNVANVLLMFSIILTLIATGWIYVSANRVDKYKDAEIKRDQQISEEKIAKANAEAAKANKGAAQANENIAGAHVQIEEAKKDAAVANQQAKQAVNATLEAKIKQGELRKENLKLNMRLNEAIAEADARQTELTEAQRKQAETEQKLTISAAQTKFGLEGVKRVQSPRTLTAGQRVALISYLGGGTKGEVDVFCVLGDAESKAFASEIDAALTSAGWKTNGVSQAVFGPNNPKGIVIAVHSEEAVPPSIFALLNALRSVGLSPQVTKNITVPENSIQMKSPPQQAAGYQKVCSGKPPLRGGRPDGHWG